MKNILIAILVLISTKATSQDSTSNKTKVHYRVNLNATLDKSIVKRLIVITNNSFSIENKNFKFEPTINYKFGYVKPNENVKVNLEDDFFTLLETQLYHTSKVFPAAIVGYESSPNFRLLNNRFYYGVGVGSYILNNKKSFLQVNLYSTNEANEMNNIKDEAYKIMPSIKSRFMFKNNNAGIVFNASYVQSLEDNTNNRIRAFVKPFVKISKHFELNAMYDTWYESKNATAFPSEISILTFGLTISN